MKPQCRSIYIACLLLVFCSFSALVGCYRGASKSDIVQIVDTQVSTSHHVAMLVERSDHAALSGPTFFVFVSDRVYSLPELRSRLYALNPVFMVGRNGMTLHWSGPDTLTIHCQDCDITKDIIEKQRFAQDGVTIQYTGFP
jgi:hypothetical protein